jgi:hypothetical protein
MIGTDSKKEVDSTWHRQYNLSSKQLEQLIAEKFKRYGICYETRKREALLVESR